jgi:hypothetical protein
VKSGRALRVEESKLDKIMVKKHKSAVESTKTVLRHGDVSTLMPCVRFYIGERKDPEVVEFDEKEEKKIRPD